MTELLTSPSHGQLARWLDEEVRGRPRAGTGRASAPCRTDRRRARPLATPCPPRPARALHGAAPPAGAARRLAPLLARRAGDGAPRPRSLGGGAVCLRRHARRGRPAVQLVQLARHCAAAIAVQERAGASTSATFTACAISARSRRPRSTSTPRRSAGWATTSSAAAACDACSAATTTERWSRDGHGEPRAARARPGRLAALRDQDHDAEARASRRRRRPHSRARTGRPRAASTTPATCRSATAGPTGPTRTGTPGSPATSGCSGDAGTSAPGRSRSPSSPTATRSACSS